MALTPAKKTMIKNMLIGAVVLSAVLVMPKIGVKVSDLLDSVRTKIGG